MEYLARFILGLIHGGKSAMHFEEVEENQENSDIDDDNVTVITVEGIISTEKVLDKIEKLGYDYYPQLDEWKIDGEFPFPEEEGKTEDKMSILGRTYLAGLGHFDVFDFDDNDTPLSVSKKQVIKLLDGYGFFWNPESSTWNKKDLGPNEVI